MLERDELKHIRTHNIIRIQTYNGRSYIIGGNAVSVEWMIYNTLYTHNCRKYNILSTDHVILYVCYMQRIHLHIVTQLLS